MINRIFRQNVRTKGKINKFKMKQKRITYTHTVDWEIYNFISVTIYGYTKKYKKCIYI